MSNKNRESQNYLFQEGLDWAKALPVVHEIFDTEDKVAAVLDLWKCPSCDEMTYVDHWEGGVCNNPNCGIWQTVPAIDFKKEKPEEKIWETKNNITYEISSVNFNYDKKTGSINIITGIDLYNIIFSYTETEIYSWDCTKSYFLNDIEIIEVKDKEGEKKSKQLFSSNFETKNLLKLLKTLFPYIRE